LGACSASVTEVNVKRLLAVQRCRECHSSVDSMLGIDCRCLLVDYCRGCWLISPFLFLPSLLLCVSLFQGYHVRYNSLAIDFALLACFRFDFLDITTQRFGVFLHLSEQLSLRALLRFRDEIYVHPVRGVSTLCCGLYTLNQFIR
jgi:hypothetical protein